MFWKLVPDERYVANPKKGSRHNRGAAVDLTLVTLSDGADVAMPTDYDDFSPRAAHSYTSLQEDVLARRALLRTVMEKHGFTAFESEWWHYDFRGWEKFELMDVSFEELAQAM